MVATLVRPVRMPQSVKGDVMNPEADMYNAEREGVDRTIPDEPEYHGPDEGLFSSRKPR